MSDLVVAAVEGEARILDTDLAARLAFERPRDIRKLIERHLPALRELGVCATVEQTSGPAGGRPGEAFYLNKKQAVFITAKSETARATEITIEVIQRFDDYENGRVAPPAPRLTGTRNVRSTFKDFHAIAKLAGFVGNQAALAANRATVTLTGVDPLAIMEAKHLTSEVQEELLNATAIGARLEGLSAQAVNLRLLNCGLHTREPGSKTVVWVPTEKGKPFGLWQDTSKRHGDGTPIRQWKWLASVIEHIREEPKLALVGADNDDGAA